MSYDWASQYRREREAALNSYRDKLRPMFLYVQRNFLPDFRWVVNDEGIVYVYRSSVVGSSVQAGPAEDWIHWDQGQVSRQSLACLGLIGLYKEDIKVASMGASKEEKTRAGAECADAWAPFLNLKIGHAMAYRLGERMAKWEGFEDDAQFIFGFVNRLMDYVQQANEKQLLIDTLKEGTN